jgi:hypothetical protein
MIKASQLDCLELFGLQQTTSPKKCFIWAYRKLTFLARNIFKKYALNVFFVFIYFGYKSSSFSEYEWCNVKCLWLKLIKEFIFNFTENTNWLWRYSSNACKPVTFGYNLNTVQPEECYRKRTYTIWSSIAYNKLC